MNTLLDRASDRSKGGEARSLFEPKWHAVWTHSHCERLVADGLGEHGFQVFLPEVRVWRRQAGGRSVAAHPLFPGYLFVRRAMDKESFIRILGVRGVVRLLGERWDRLAVIPDAEIDGVQRVLGASFEPRPHPYLREGQRVKIKSGPLAGVEGFLVTSQQETGSLVLSIDLFCRSIAVEVDCTLAAPA